MNLPVLSPPPSSLSRWVRRMAPCLLALPPLLAGIALLLQAQGGWRPVPTLGLAVGILGLLLLAGAWSLARALERQDAATARVESGLREQADRLQQLLDASGEALLEIDRHGTCTFCNATFLRLMGHDDRSEVLGRHLDDLVGLAPGALPMDPRPAFRRAIQEGCSHQVEDATLQRTDGTWFWADCRWVPQFQEGQLAGGVVTLLDITERRLARQALEESQLTLRQVLDTIPQCVYWKDQDSRYLGCNQAFATLVGMSDPTPLTGLTDHDLPLARARAETYRADDRAVMDGAQTVRRRSEAIKAPGGQVFWIESTKVPLRRADGTPFGVLGIFEDITERRRQDAELRASRARLAEAQALAHLGSWEMDLATRALRWSDECYRIFGLDPAEADITLAHFLSLLHPEDRAEVIRTFKGAAATGAPFHLSHRLLLPDGRMKVLDVKGQIEGHPDGRRTSALGTMQDITDQKQAEEALRASRARLAEAQALAHLGNWELELGTGRLVWSEEIYRIFGLEPERFGASYDAFLAAIHPEDRELVQRTFQTSVDTHTPYYVTHRLLLPDGTLKYVEERGQTIYDAEGTPERSLGTVQDITELMKAEDELRRLLRAADQSRRALLSLLEDQRASDAEVRRLNADLELRVAERTRELALANQELEAFAYSVSHDLRAPLRHMDGFLGLLARHLGEGLDPKGVHYLQVAQKAAVRMGQLVDGLLSFSRLGRTELRRVSVDMDALVASLLEEFRPECAGRSVTWQIGALPVLQGDPTLLRLVLQNLIGNALKFTRTRSEAHLAIRALDGLDGEVGLAIQDNGVGFDPTYTHKLFGVFQRLHREDEFEGTGIGLANVHRIITRHGGRIWAEGALDAGATFHFAFPVTETVP